MKFSVAQTTPISTGTGQTLKSGGVIFNTRPKVIQVNSEWTFRDYLGAFLSRVSSYRNRYRVEPGLYKIGNPDAESDVLVSANYKLSFDHLRRPLKNRNFWILVLDTKGINVWCAAGKGTFGTGELVHRIQQTQLLSFISHKRIIVPQLGGPGVNAHAVRKQTGLRVYYGPILAKDIPAFIDNGQKATTAMRQSRFNFIDRFVLIPMEINPVARYFLYYSLGILIFAGLQFEGILFKNALFDGLPFLAGGLGAIVSGTILTPLLLPFLPGRAFSVKGALMGIAVTCFLYFFTGLYAGNIFLSLYLAVFLPLMSSFLALQFTGSSTFTNLSGVQKEHKYAIPVYLGGIVLSSFLLVLYKIQLMGLL